MEQLTLNFSYNKDYLKTLLEKSSGKEISLIITDNSTSILSVKAKNETICVRLHRMFLDAGPEVIKEVAEFIKKRQGKTPLIRGFINERREILKKPSYRKLTVRTNGRHYDLLGIYDSLNTKYFGRSLSVTITWGAKSPRGAVRKRTLGSYGSHTNTIRINPVLDSINVPDYFIEFVVYHEMLHAWLGVITINGRRIAHSKEFRAHEKNFTDYERAMAWEKKQRF